MMSPESVKKDMTSTPTLSGEVVSPRWTNLYVGHPPGLLTPSNPKDKSVGPASLRGRQGLSGEHLKLDENFHVHDTDIAPKLA